MPSRHGRPDRILVARTANAKTCPGCRRTFGGCRGGRRSGPTHRSGSERYFPSSPDLFLPPQSPAGSSTPKDGPKNYRAGQILARGRVPGRNRVTGDPFRLGVGIMAARSPARYGPVSYTHLTLPTNREV